MANLDDFIVAGEEQAVFPGDLPHAQAVNAYFSCSPLQVTSFPSMRQVRWELAQECFQEQQRRAAGSVAFLTMMCLHTFYLKALLRQNLQCGKALRQSVDAKTEVRGEHDRRLCGERLDGR